MEEPSKVVSDKYAARKKPIPALYIRHTIDMEKEKSVREVVDGQQRIRSILSFVNDEFTVRDPSDSKRKKYSKLSKEQKLSFRSISLPVGYLLGASDSDVIDIFGRINSVSKTLNPQEKLNAKFSGDYKQFCLATASNYVVFWKDRNVFSPTNISRMEEVRFVADVTMNLLEGLQDTTARKLEITYGRYDEKFDDYEMMKKCWEGIMVRLIEIDPATIKDTIFNRHPILFSLILVLKDNPRLKGLKLQAGMRKIDAMFVDEDLQKADISEFRRASASSTPRIGSRRVRHKFIQDNLLS